MAYFVRSVLSWNIFFVLEKRLISPSEINRVHHSPTTTKT